MKVPIQEKIAELEARIADLEKNAALHTGFASRVTRHVEIQEDDPHWKETWYHFDKIFEHMRKMFKAAEKFFED